MVDNGCPLYGTGVEDFTLGLQSPRVGEGAYNTLSAFGHDLLQSVLDSRASGGRRASPRCIPTRGDPWTPVWWCDAGAHPANAPLRGSFARASGGLDTPLPSKARSDRSTGDRSAKITFLGAAGEVTGSQHLIETRNLRLLLDCGFFQGPRSESRSKNERFHCRPRDLDGVILSHAHIDHCGNLPGLYRDGYRGNVFCTEATADIAEQMLLDSAKIQEEDARYLSRRLNPGHPPVEPLYTEEDVRGILRKFHPVGFHEWHELATDCRVRFVPAGHILGSAITELEILDGSDWKKVVFTGMSAAAGCRSSSIPSRSTAQRPDHRGDLRQ